MNLDQTASFFAERNGSVGGALGWGFVGCYFKTHCQTIHCVLSLSKTLYPLLSTGSTSDPIYTDSPTGL